MKGHRLCCLLFVKGTDLHGVMNYHGSFNKLCLARWPTCLCCHSIVRTEAAGGIAFCCGGDAADDDNNDDDDGDLEQL